MEEKGQKKNNKILILVTGILCIIFLISMFLTYKNEWSQAMQEPWAVYTYQDRMGERLYYKLNDDEIVSQDIKMASKQITGISLYMKYKNLDGLASIKVKLIDKNTKRILKMWNFSMENSMDGFVNFYFEKGCKVKQDKLYTIKIEASGIGNQVIELQRAGITKTSMTDGMEINEEKHNYAFAYRTLNGDCTSLKYIFCVFVLTIITTFIGVVICIMKNKKLQIIFIVAAMGLGVAYMFMISPFVVPDEASHFATCYAESSVLMGKEVCDENTGEVIADIDAADYLIREEIPTKNTYVRYIKGVCGKTENVIAKKTLLRTPLSMKNIGYIPQVIGISVARVFHMNSEQLLYMGRLFALIWYCFIMYWAIKLIPEWKMILWIIGLCPMTLQQVVSYNYDSVLLGITFFLVAYTLFLKFDKDKITKRDIIIIGISVFGIASIKFVYLPLVGIALLIPKEKFDGMKKKCLISALICVIGVGGILITNLATMTHIVTTGADSGTTAIGNELTYFSMASFIHQPKEVIKVFYRTFEFSTSGYIESMLAAPLGWIDLGMPSLVILGLVVLLMLCWQKKNVNVKFNWKEKIWLIFIGIMIIFLVMLSLMIDCTYVGSRTILGIQGRYFLPILSVLLIATQTNKLTLQTNQIEKYEPIILIAIQAYAIWYVTMTVVCR
ncbi:DUF2142 domain-containing protein [Dorea formicigenerans]|uniref:DUF2142 domain-containing protein n=1 Tax=Dorea formicigenerans TaxID=39486 RepID=UPI000E436AF8|nr:DUF2142 domain-containing protein [Dorea formicigenerans]RGJ66387.1 DUF2142 domain-containing protein [Dorea formicigenerans]